MRSRSSHVRSKVVALLVSLFALWAFAAYVTVREGLNLLWISTLDRNVGRPSDALVAELQQERRLSLVYLGTGARADREALRVQRARTDSALATFSQLATSSATKNAADRALEALIDEALAHLDGLSSVREAVDAGRVDRNLAAQRFTEIIDAQFRLYEPAAAFDDKAVAKEGRTLIALTRAREMLAREDALLAGMLADGTFTPADHRTFIRLVGAQRLLHDEAAKELRDEDRARYEQMVAGPVFQRFRNLEERVMAWDGGKPPVTAAEWDDAVGAVLAQGREFVQTVADAAVERAKPAATWVIVRLVLAGGLGLLAVVASIVISVTTARALVRQLERLRDAARELADYRLPRVVERLQHGERVDVAREAPPLEFGNSEIGQVGQAFNAVQETAIRVAVEQAELRRSVRDVFLSLARRSQALLHRQLALLDAMERRATDAEDLAELFRVDHLATRMRRNAENLIVLSGATAGRAWRKPVPMVDVMRAALAEVEDYTRVTVLPAGSAALVGRAVGDVIHLLAELIENAVTFSPPQTVVRVGGSMVGNGYAIEIEDRGLGMSEEERAAANEQLRNPPEFKLSSTARLGLYVVGKLAERHGIRVQLKESPYGGTTAIVLLPPSLIVEDSDNQPGGDATHEAKPAAAARVGRHRQKEDDDPDEGRFGYTSTHRGSDPVPATTSVEASVPVKPPRSPDDTSANHRSAPTIFTPAGLPWRPRPADVGRQPSSAPSSMTKKPGRSAEEVRAMMASYRTGTLRGRSEAARLGGTESVGGTASRDTPAPAAIDDSGRPPDQPRDDQDHVGDKPAIPVQDSRGPSEGG